MATGKDAGKSGTRHAHQYDKGRRENMIRRWKTGKVTVSRINGVQIKEMNKTRNRNKKAEKYKDQENLK